MLRGTRWGRLVAAVVSAVVVGSTIQMVATVSPAVADTSPAPASDPTNPETASAKPLPTAQIGNGVVWSQAIIGNTVYVAGQFSTARPAGVAPGGAGEVPRSNLLAYNITTGQLIDSWTPSTNDTVAVIKASPDKSRLYIGGNFSTVNGTSKGRIAALDPTTGALVKGFAASVDAKVQDIVPTDTTVFAGGTFTQARGAARSHLAAFSLTGTVLPWAPVAAGGNVSAMTLTPDGTRLVVGGQFTTLNGSSNPGFGMGALDPSTGANVPWAANSLIRNAGTNSGINSLSTDNDSVYVTGFKFGGTGNLEGVARINNDGTVNWVSDCHGDTYGAYASAGVVYKVSHTHFCGNVPGGFNQPATWKFYRAMAFSKVATGVTRKDYVNYSNWQGVKDPSILQWFPQIDVGTFTGQTQAAWTITGNDDYVVAGGEFPKTDGVAQQGLVRYAKKSAVPATQAPELSGNNFLPTVTAHGPGEALVSWQSTFDRDNRNLTYKVYRDNNTTTPVYTVTQGSNPWDRPFLNFLDTGLSAGTHSYRVWTTDPDGNTSKGNAVSVTVSGSGTATDAYTKAVLQDGPESLWRLDEPSGTSLADYTGYDKMTATSGVTPGAAGAISGHTAATLSGSGSAAGAVANDGPWWYTVEAWVKTTSTAGGRIVGFSGAKTGNSASNQYDRVLYMSPSSGKLNFGTMQGTSKNVLTTASSYNNGAWHHVVGVVGDSGMNLYVDGARVGQRTDIHTGGSYVGYWRIGGDTLSGWANAPTTSAPLAGQVDEVAVYQEALSADQIRAHYVASGRTVAGTPAPTDSYGKAVYDDGPDLYWRLGETSGTVANDSSQNGNPGTYVNSPTQGGASAVGVASDKSIATNGTTQGVSLATATTAPSVYSEELWFKTATAGQTSGGELIGFGSSKTGNSTTYDRSVYMTSTGTLRFGVFPSSTDVGIESPNAYNDAAWHHVVASQGTGGMRLYVDGQQVATSPEVNAVSGTGYWRVGGDNLAGRTSRPSSDYFKGSLDEVAVYPTALSIGSVQAHFSKAGGTVANSQPTAAFTSTATGKKVAFDGSSSSDADGSIASYAWDFGAGEGTATGASPNHTFTAAGDQTVSLTVTDDKGATNTVTKTVHVVNSAPTADFTSSVNGKVVSFAGTPSSDVDGTVASYAWTFGDGSPVDTTSGVNVSHTYASAGAKTVTLTVTDNDGTSSPVTTKTVTAGNAKPTANYTSTATDLHADFTSSSTDSDGTIASYAWDFGDASPVDTTSGATVGHDFAAAGTYSVKLTVTDNEGGTDTVTKSVSVSAAGTATTLASDDFGRTASSGWGSAVLGGAWSRSAGTSNADFGVNSGSGYMLTGIASQNRGQALGAVSAADTDATAKVSLDKIPDATTYLFLGSRVNSGLSYRAKVKLVASTGVASLSVVSSSGNTDTVIASGSALSTTLTPGAQLQIRLQVVGSGTSSTVRAKAWLAGTSEPGAWQASGSDSTAALQSAGGVSLADTIGGATNIPVTARWDDLLVTTVP